MRIPLPLYIYIYTICHTLADFPHLVLCLNVSLLKERKTQEDHVICSEHVKQSTPTLTQTQSLTLTLTLTKTLTLNPYNKNGDLCSHFVAHAPLGITADLPKVKMMRQNYWGKTSMFRIEENRIEDKTRQDKTRHGATRQDKTR